jgi:hypothetical protein
VGSYDELVARIGSCRLPLPCSELEFLGFMAHSLRHAICGRTRYHFYVRAFNHHGGARLIRAERSTNSCIRPSTDFAAPSWHYYDISVAEFDRELDRNPEMVRPYMYAIGDHRRGQELLDSAHLDQQRETLANLQKTPQGREMLDNLARVMDETIGATLRELLAASTPASPSRFLDPPHPEK